MALDTTGSLCPCMRFEILNDGLCHGGSRNTFIEERDIICFGAGCVVGGRANGDPFIKPPIGLPDIKSGIGFSLLPYTLWLMTPNLWG